MNSGMPSQNHTTVRLARMTSTHARRHGGALGCQAPPAAAGAPQMKILQMELHASDLAPLCSV